MGAAGRSLVVELPPAASPPGASFFSHRPGALGREFLVKRAIGFVVLVGPQGVHQQEPFFRVRRKPGSRPSRWCNFPDGLKA